MLGGTVRGPVGVQGGMNAAGPIPGAGLRQVLEYNARGHRAATGSGGTLQGPVGRNQRSWIRAQLRAQCEGGAEPVGV